MNTLKAGMTFMNADKPENRIRIEAVDQDGSILVSFPGKPEKGTNTLDPAGWAEMNARFRLITSPLDL